MILNQPTSPKYLIDNSALYLTHGLRLSDHGDDKNTSDTLSAVIPEVSDRGSSVLSISCQINVATLISSYLVTHSLLNKGILKRRNKIKCL